MMEAVPNQTLYVAHVYEKLKKEGMFFVVVYANGVRRIFTL